LSTIEAVFYAWSVTRSYLNDNWGDRERFVGEAAEKGVK
jgi:hypothetical protein